MKYKKAFGMIEFLLVIAIACLILFLNNNSKTGRENPFAENSNLEAKSQLVDDKIQEINDSKALRKMIENNLKKGY